MLKTPQQTHVRWWVSIIWSTICHLLHNVTVHYHVHEDPILNPPKTAGNYFTSPYPHTYITFLSMYRPPKWVIPTASLDISETSKIYCFCWKFNRYCSVIQPIAESLYQLCCLSSQNNQFIYHMKMYIVVQWQMLNTKKTVRWYSISQYYPEHIFTVMF